VAKGKEIVTEMSHCSSLFSLLKCYMKAVLYCISFVSCLLFWPIAVLFIKYYNDGKYYLSKGKNQAAAQSLFFSFASSNPKGLFKRNTNVVSYKGICEVEAVLSVSYNRILCHSTRNSCFA
jgi:hypothetical protein